MSLQGSSLLEETTSTLLGLSSLHLPSCGFTEKRRGGRRGFSVGVGVGVPEECRGCNVHTLPAPAAPLQPLSSHLWRSLFVSAPCSCPCVARGLGPSRGPGWCGNRSLQEKLGAGVASSKRPSEHLNLVLAAKREQAA